MRRRYRRLEKAAYTATYAEDKGDRPGDRRKRSTSCVSERRERRWRRHQRDQCIRHGGAGKRCEWWVAAGCPSTRACGLRAVARQKRLRARPADQRRKEHTNGTVSVHKINRLVSHVFSTLCHTSRKGRRRCVCFGLERVCAPKSVGYHTHVSNQITKAFRSSLVPAIAVTFVNTKMWRVRIWLHALASVGRQLTDGIVWRCEPFDLKRTHAPLTTVACVRSLQGLGVRVVWGLRCQMSRRGRGGPKTAEIHYGVEPDIFERTAQTWPKFDMGKNRTSF